MTTLILCLGWIALITLILIPIAWCVVTLAPKTLDFVKSLIKWHSHDDDDWYL